ncbi:alpha-galactosidase [Bifidobacterium platyrrhinorum]|uniref:alpha-galactosidase n=1 Tax=Bifidobacterium platyrrhinorum TaxID=2661628 RepID=A0A6L9ST37_9BIFI|nr:alpha-galactosidase [Bifidobacterium platyrrhinorum]NEG55664.1 alpha-galactosidase [Bifidobacterium platyrrhinorum]
MTRIERFAGTAADGTPITLIYAEQAGTAHESAVTPESAVAFALAFPGGELPRFVHWGKPVAAPETLISQVDALRPQRVSGALDETMWPSILPTQSESWIGQKRFEVRRGGIELFPKFTVTDIATTLDARPALDVTQAVDAPESTPAEARVAAPVTTVDTPVVTVTAEDAEQGVRLVWTVELLHGGLIRQRAAITDTTGAASDALEIGKVELGFPLPAVATEILTTTGHHLRERSPQRQPLTVGRFEKVSLAGRPDFDASLLLTAGVPGFGFEHGEAYAVHVGWSGNSVLAAERQPYTDGMIGGGEILFGGEATLHGDAATDTYTTPWVYGATGDGLNQVAARFHTHLRDLHPELASKPRPVILNTWEAVYFQHDYDTLTALADKAAATGVERFVVDDGWFGSRRDDTSGLGDWQISSAVWPDGPKSLKALADHVHGKGMEFGLWFEPEMINPDSDTYRAHPDWVLKSTPNRLPMQGRSQQVLDLTNPEAYAYIYNAMDGLVGSLSIDYIKWDHNKLVTEAATQRFDNGGGHGYGVPAVHAQTLAVYRIFRDLKAAHPGLEIESCSSGGGRVDLGILELADRIWVSDCVDPVERADIQRYTSLLVPPCMMGEHVGASPAHSTQRATSQELRMAMAFYGHMGIEWNLLKEPDADVAKLAAWVAEFKRHRAWFAVDTCVHTDTPDPAVRVDGMVKPDRTAAFYRFTQLTTSQTYPASPVRLPGLDPDATYRVQPLHLDLDLAALGIGNGQSPLGWWTPDGVLMTGRTLAAYGLRPPSLHPAQSVLFTVVRQ